MLAPVLVILALVVAYPMLRTLYLSFTSARLTAFHVTPKWVGLSNYANAVGNTDLQAALARTAYFTVVSVAVEVVLGVLVALLLNQKFRGRAFARALLILPWALPTIVNAIMWRWIYSPEFGSLNALLTQLHLLPAYRSWLGEPGVAMNMVIIADVWKNYPLVAMIALAALQSIPGELFEAAAIDGANSWVRFWRITLPSIFAPLMVAVVLRCIEAFKVFDIIYVMTRGGPVDSTKTATFYVYQEAFTYLRSGSGASYAYLMVLISLVFIGAYITLLRRQERR